MHIHNTKEYAICMMKMVYGKIYNMVEYIIKVYPYKIISVLGNKLNLNFNRCIVLIYAYKVAVILNECI